MSLSTTEEQFKQICTAVGLEVNGSKPWDPHVVHPEVFYSAFAKDPFMAMGESFVAGHYTVADISGMISRLYQPDTKEVQQKLLTNRQKFRSFAYHARRCLLNANRRFSFQDSQKRGQSKIADVHYDLDNELMVAMLGPSVKYTSGYWHPQYGPFDLDTAQRLDLEIIAQRMGLQSGMRVLDIGFGYGTNTKYFIEHYDVEVVGLTISDQQKTFAEKVCREMSDKARFILSDWRDIASGQLGYFDRVMNLEMIESIGGPKNYPAFFTFMHDMLKEDGAVFVQAINVHAEAYETNPWIEKYIFPHGVLPTPTAMVSAAHKAGLHTRLIDNSLGWANGQTCKGWWDNFARNWPELKDMVDPKLGITKALKYKRHFEKLSPYESSEETFPRIWKLYLLGCFAAHVQGFIADGHFIWEKNPKNATKPDIIIPQSADEVEQFLSST